MEYVSVQWSRLTVLKAKRSVALNGRRCAIVVGGDEAGRRKKEKDAAGLHSKDGSSTLNQASLALSLFRFSLTPTGASEPERERASRQGLANSSCSSAHSATRTR